VDWIRQALVKRRWAFCKTVLHRVSTWPTQVCHDYVHLPKKHVKCEDIPVTGREGPYDWETSRIPHFVDNRLTDGGEVVSPTRLTPFTPQEDSWYSFLLEAESTLGP
jgi:hypothetical protein